MITIFGLVIAFSVVGYVLYAIGVITKKTEASKASWIIWIGLDVVILAGMSMKDLKEEDRIHIICCTIGATCISLLSLWYGTPGWTIIDKICLVAGFVGAILLALAPPLAAIGIGVAAVGIGSIPMIQLAWKTPEKENKLAWIAFSISAIFAVLNVKVWTWEGGFQPVAFAIIETAITALILLRPLFIAKPNTQKP